MQTVLIIDDNAAVAIALDVLFSLHDIHAISAASPAEGLALLDREPIDLVIQDMNFTADTTSGEEGIALFRQIRARHPDLPVILLTAWTHLDAAVDLVKSGAADYLAKPWVDQRLIATVTNLLELGQANRALDQRVRHERRQRRELAARFDLRGVVWRDAAMEAVLNLACQVARADVPVLISGPNGTGKERIAEIIQANSQVAQGPFVVLNCGALPAELIEAELFGADAGAYTGASKAREGKFEAADGGTLFLDEIGNLPPAGQMKLLRVLETGRFERLGSNRERQVKVRVISATNADLPAMIRAGTFREDLFYRLNLIELRLPALGARPDDILPLAHSFISAGKTLAPAAQAALLAHGWPGNVRELKNVMARACLLATGAVIGAGDLGLPAPRASAVAAADNEPDRELIAGALARANGVHAQAAAELGLSRQALYRRMERLGIARPGMKDHAAPRRPLRLSLLTRWSAMVATLSAMGAIIALALAHLLPGRPLLAAALSMLCVAPIAVITIRAQIQPMLSLFRALEGTVSSYRDGDFSFSLHWPQHDELSELVASHNALGQVLREQRLELTQRELLLDTMVQNTPVAMLLVADGGAGGRAVVYANLAARQLLNRGHKLEGFTMDGLLAQSAPALREALARSGDGLFTTGEGELEEVYHLARRHFQLNGRRHELLLLRQLTAELRRQEVQTWKKVIRVISHELNNSLAPMASLAHSGAELVRRGHVDRLPQILATIEERTRHLESFILGYASFAKLPTPRPGTVAWPPFIEHLASHLRFRLSEPAPPEAASFDAAQLQQALLNLLKNAHESGSPPEQVELRISRAPDLLRIEVSDRGAGMSEAVLTHALVPFYSTKRSGTGLGLALAREIAEAHGGRITLANREGGGLTVTLILPA